LIRNGNEVIISTAPGVDDNDMAPFITGAILGNLLDQRGFLVLHGSAIATSGNGIAFLGEKGAGKSTFAAHMQKHGFPLITDDLIPVSFADGGITTLPGFPRIRLWGDSLDSVGADPATAPKINKFVDKRSFHCGENFAIEPVTVDAIYVLTLDDDVSIELLKPSEAFIELTRNTYLNRYLHASGKHSDNFRGCEMIVRSVPIFRLRRPHDFDRLPEVASAVMDHIAQPQRHSSVRHARSSLSVAVSPVSFEHFRKNIQLSPPLEARSVAHLECRARIHDDLGGIADIPGHSSRRHGIPDQIRYRRCRIGKK
jgi:hypothetical protein